MQVSKSKTVLCAPVLGGENVHILAVTSDPRCGHQLRDGRICFLRARYIYVEPHQHQYLCRNHAELDCMGVELDGLDNVVSGQ